MNRTLSALILFFIVISSVPARAADRAAHIAMIAFDTPFTAACRGLRQGMKNQGFIEGKDIVFSEYNIKKDKSMIPRLVAELAAQKTDLIFTVTTPVVLNVRQEAEKHNIPVIFSVVADPVGAGIVSSLRHPETMSGISHIAFELVPRRLILFKQAFPQLKKVAVFYDPDQQGLQRNLNNPAFQAAAREEGLEIITFHVHDKEEMARACATITGKTIDGIFMMPDAMSAALFGQMVKLSRREKLPMMVIDNMMLNMGGVLGYSPDFYEVGRQAAAMVTTVLSGTAPGMLPVENPDRIKLVVSLKEAKRLGLIFSADFLTRADEIIR